MTREASEQAAAIVGADGSDLVAQRIELQPAIPAHLGNGYQLSVITPELADAGRHLAAFAVTESGASLDGMSTGT